MIPNCKILTYTGAVNDYTITDDVINVHVNDILNDVGTFHFTLPAMKGTAAEGYVYSDIAVNDLAKIFLWYSDESCPGTPYFVGRITKISAPMQVDSGYYRVYQGKSLAEILERRIKPAKQWFATDASDIVTEIANDLGLGVGSIQGDTNDPTFFTDDEPYIDLLRTISDYWVSAGTQIKKDWYVDVDANLVWHVRPIRSSGVETLSIGQNIESYNVLDDVQAVKNYIKVYGAYDKNAYMPLDDGWAESTDEWSKYGFYGIISREDADFKAGSHAIKCTSEADDGNNYIGFKRTLLPDENHIQCIDQYSNNSFGKIHFWAKCSRTTSIWFNILGAPGANSIAFDLTANTWIEKTVTFGEDNGGYSWTGGNDPLGFTNINYIAFTSAAEPAPFTLIVDDIYFLQGRYRGYAEDSGVGSSQESYEQRDMVYVIDSLKSSDECRARAERLLYQQKDLPTRIDIKTSGNNNLRVGDRLSITIPAEGISAANYDLLSVTADYSKTDFTMNCGLINAIDIRQLPVGNPYESILKGLAYQREIGKGIKIIK